MSYLKGGRSVHTASSGSHFKNHHRGRVPVSLVHFEHKNRKSKKLQALAVPKKQAVDNANPVDALLQYSVLVEVANLAPRLR